MNPIESSGKDKSAADPPKDKPNEKKVDPNRGIPETTNIPTEDQPSPQMNLQKGQAEFMKPERADRDSNRQSGAV